MQWQRNDEGKKGYCGSLLGTAHSDSGQRTTKGTVIVEAIALLLR